MDLGVWTHRADPGRFPGDHLPTATGPRCYNARQVGFSRAPPAQRRMRRSCLTSTYLHQSMGNRASIGGCTVGQALPDRETILSRPEEDSIFRKNALFMFFVLLLPATLGISWPDKRKIKQGPSSDSIKAAHAGRRRFPVDDRRGWCRIG